MVRSCGKEPSLVHVAWMLPVSWFPPSCLHANQVAGYIIMSWIDAAGTSVTWHKSCSSYSSFRLVKAPLPPHSGGSVPANTDRGVIKRAC